MSKVYQIWAFYKLIYMLVNLIYIVPSVVSLSLLCEIGDTLYFMLIPIDGFWIKPIEINLSTE